VARLEEKNSGGETPPERTGARCASHFQDAASTVRVDVRPGGLSSGWQPAPALERGMVTVMSSAAAAFSVTGK